MSTYLCVSVRIVVYRHVWNHIVVCVRAGTVDVMVSAVEVGSENEVEVVVLGRYQQMTDPLSVPLVRHGTR